jgi:endonuclease YncB( thermonuclease family)
VLVLVVLAALFGRPLERMAPGPLGPGEFGELSGYVTVIDGDSLRLGGSEVRLVGIDAPEGRQTCQRDGREWDCGEESRRQLQRLIGRQKVSCRSVKRDKHGRYLGTCEAGGKTLNSAMVESGCAVSYGSYGAEERAAKAAGRGIWSGTFQMPREWRRERGIGR